VIVVGLIRLEPNRRFASAAVVARACSRLRVFSTGGGGGGEPARGPGVGERSDSAAAESGGNLAIAARVRQGRSTSVTSVNGPGR